MSTVGAVNPVDALAVLFRYVIAFVFLFAAVPKIANAAAFKAAVANYRLLPRRVAPLVARALPWLELLCAVALSIGLAVTPVAAMAGLVLVTFAVAVSVNLLRGREITCGCDGSLAPHFIDWPLVLSDLALAGMAVLVAVRNPLVLVVYSHGGWFHTSTLSGTNGIAFMAVAGTAVLLKAIVATVIDLRPVLRSVTPG